MRSDLISREVLLSEYDNNFIRYKDFRDFLENVPDVEIRDSLFVNGYAQGYEDAKAKFERPQGEWIFMQGVTCGGYYKCNKCGEVERAEKNYCSNCGSEMRGKEE